MTHTLWPTLWLLAAYCTAVILQLTLGYRVAWRLRGVIASVSTLLFFIATIGLLADTMSVLVVCLALTSAYSVFNLLRVLCTLRTMPRILEILGKGNQTEAQLFQTSNRTALWLGGMQATLIAGLAVWHDLSVMTLGPWAVGLALCQLVVAVALVWSARRQVKKARAPAITGDEPKQLADKYLPSITVAIPARNEDAQLQACLDSILRSSYPKLEVIVLDDCSADRTPDIIKQYAHDGVRFVRGKEPAADWLPKNQAYDRLLQEASGKLVLFCGVDVRFRSGSIRLLEATMRAKQKTIVGVLPQNELARRVPAIQAMRYYWEMVPPRRLFRRPPVLSSCWLAAKDELVKAGGFAAVKRSMSPEAYFAHQAIQHDGYSFVRSDSLLGITSEKNIHDQYETAVYSRYPQLHRRPELVMLLSVAEIALLVGPLALVPLSLAGGLGWLPAAASALAFILNSYAFATAQQAIFTSASFISACLSFPLAIISDLWMVNFSMYKYEFSQVIWKDRNVSFPVMNPLRVIPHLPKLER
jgi:glycosyltransferase involved in cell wall biosynthesis